MKKKTSKTKNAIDRKEREYVKYRNRGETDKMR